MISGSVLKNSTHGSQRLIKFGRERRAPLSNSIFSYRFCLKLPFNLLIDSFIVSSTGARNFLVIIYFLKVIFPSHSLLLFQSTFNNVMMILILMIDSLIDDLTAIIYCIILLASKHTINYARKLHFSEP